MLVKSAWISVIGWARRRVLKARPFLLPPPPVAAGEGFGFEGVKWVDGGWDGTLGTLLRGLTREAARWEWLCCIVVKAPQVFQCCPVAQLVLVLEWRRSRELNETSGLSLIISVILLFWSVLYTWHLLHLCLSVCPWRGISLECFSCRELCWSKKVTLVYN